MAGSQADRGERRLIPGAVAAGGHLWSSVLLETSFHLAYQIYIRVYEADNLAKPSWLAGG